MKRDELTSEWKKRIVGQDHAIEKIVPYLVRAFAGLNVPGRPIGNFFLMGPTGTGKTRTAETLAEVLHGTERNIMRIDCGEFQMEHEIAKLIGAPPGYLGHRETQPVFTQQKLNALTTDGMDYSIVLFDEIEKASPSMWRILLGVLDKAILKSGDNSIVNFEKTIIFMSSNIGAAELTKMLSPGFGFNCGDENQDVTESQLKQMETIGMAAFKKKFPPEFPNRMDEIIMYHPLEGDTLTQITAMEIDKVQKFIGDRLQANAFFLQYAQDTVDFLTSVGTSRQYGARELKRAINRHLMNPLSDHYIDETLKPGALVNIRVCGDRLEWDFDDGDNTEETVDSATPPRVRRTRKPK